MKTANEKAMHTPTPWEVVKHQDYWRVAQKNGFLESEIAMCLRKENAQFIVRAVNSYKKLIEIARCFEKCQAGEAFYTEVNVPELIAQAERP